MNQTMDQTLHYTMLLDFYGDLLTERQRGVCEGYYAQNLSTGELAENLGVSRQAAHRMLRVSMGLLESYEGTLGLLAAHERRLALAAALDREIDGLAELVGAGRLSQMRRIAALLEKE